MLECVGPTTKSGQLVSPPVSQLELPSTEQLTGVTATQEQLKELLSSTLGFQFGVNTAPLFQWISSAMGSGCRGASSGEQSGGAGDSTFISFTPVSD